MTSNTKKSIYEIISKSAEDIRDTLIHGNDKDRADILLNLRTKGLSKSSVTSISRYPKSANSTRLIKSFLRKSMKYRTVKRHPPPSAMYKSTRTRNSNKNKTENKKKQRENQETRKTKKTIKIIKSIM